MEACDRLVKSPKFKIHPREVFERGFYFQNVNQNILRTRVGINARSSPNFKLKLTSLISPN